MVEEGLRKNGFWLRKEDSSAFEHMVAVLLKVAKLLGRIGPLEVLLERNNIRAVLLEIAGTDVKYE